MCTLTRPGSHADGPEADIRCPSPVYRVLSWGLGNWREKEQIVSFLMRKCSFSWTFGGYVLV